MVKEEAAIPNDDLANKLFGVEFTLRQAMLTEELWGAGAGRPADVPEEAAA